MKRLRIIALLLSMTMIFCALPNTNVFADNKEESVIDEDIMPIVGDALLTDSIPEQKTKGLDNSQLEIGAENELITDNILDKDKGHIIVSDTEKNFTEEPSISNNNIEAQVLQKVSQDESEPDATNEVFVVNSIEELISKIGSNRTIILSDGIYRTSKTIEIYKYDSNWNKEEISNLHIQAANPGKAEILLDQPTSDVLCLSYCKNVTVQGLILGHDPIGEVGCAEGDVIEIYNSDNINVKECDLYGCGWSALNLNNVGTMTVNNCILRDCTFNAICYDAYDVSMNLKMNSCVISGNTKREMLPYNGYEDSDYFWIDLIMGYSSKQTSARITCHDCKFLNNKSITLASDEVRNGISFDSGCQFYNNIFDNQSTKNYGICVNGLTWQVENSILKIGYPITTSDGKVLNNDATETLSYSDSSIPWKDVSYTAYDINNGISYSPNLFKGKNISDDPDNPGGEYVINYVLNGGENHPNNPKSYSKVNKKIKLNKPTKKGYKFTAWYSDPNFKKKSNAIKKNSKGDLTFYAKWGKPINYSISYKLNGGKFSDKNVLKKYTVETSNFTLPVPVKNGYDFGGWYTEKDCSGVPLTQLDTSKAENYKLYACWTYTIKYDANDTNATGFMSPTICQYRKKVQLSPNQFTKTGHTFKRWTTQSNGKGSKYKDMQVIKNSPDSKQGKEVTLYASWDKNIYTVLFDPHGGTGKMSELKNRRYDITYSLPKNKFKRDGYSFVSWNTEPDGSGISYADQSEIRNLTIDNKVCVTLYAQWAIQTYTIQYENLDNDVINRNPGEYTYSDVPITLNPAEKPGYDFSGWYTDKELQKTAKTPEITKNSLGNKVFYAKFTEKTCNISFDANGGSGKMAKQTLKYSDTLPSNKFNNGESSFIGWNTKSDGKGNSYFDKAAVSSIIDNEGATVTLYAQWSRIADPVFPIDIANPSKLYACTYGGHSSYYENGGEDYYEGTHMGTEYRAVDMSGGGIKKDSTNVFAVESGTVVNCRPSSDGSVYIKHTIPLELYDGSKTYKIWYTVYAHMSNVKVKKGDEVSRGQIIGKVSDKCSNGAVPVHLHFSVTTKLWKGNDSIHGGYRNGGTPDDIKEYGHYTLAPAWLGGEFRNVKYVPKENDLADISAAERLNCGTENAP